MYIDTDVFAAIRADAAERAEDCRTLVRLLGALTELFPPVPRAPSLRAITGGGRRARPRRPPLHVAGRN